MAVSTKPPARLTQKAPCKLIRRPTSYRHSIFLRRITPASVLSVTHDLCETRAAYLGFAVGELTFCRPDRQLSEQEPDLLVLAPQGGNLTVAFIESGGLTVDDVFFRRSR